MNTKALLAIGAVVGAVVFGGASAQAAVLIWTGAASGSWSNAANWSPAVAPVDGDALRFAPGATTLVSVNDLSGLAVASIVIAGNGNVLTGNSLVVNGPISWGGTGNVLSLPIDFKANAVAVGATDGVSGDLSFTGGIAGTGTLALQGPIVLSGAPSYSGSISIGCNAFGCGRVLLDAATLQPAITVGTGGRLLGNGTLGTLSVNGGTVAPSTGVAAPGTIVAADVTVTGGGTLAALISRPGSFSQLAVTNSLTLANAIPQLQLDARFIPGVNQVYRLVDNRGSAPITGTLNGFAEGSFEVLGGVPYRLSYVGGDGNDLTLTSTLVPKTWTGSVSAKWSDAGNWSDATVPKLGDFLVFPSAAANLATNNDIAGLRLQGLALNGGVGISGSALVIGEGISWSGAGNTVSASVDFEDFDVLLAQSDAGTPQELVFAGGVAGSGKLTMQGRVRLQAATSLTGPIIASCSVQCGRLDLASATAVSSVALGTGTGILGSGTVGAVTSVGGDVTIQGPAAFGGRLSTGAFSLTNGALALNIGGTTAGTDFAQLAVQGTVTLANATLVLTGDPTFTPSVGQAFLLVDNGGADPVAGTFNGLAEGALLVANAQLYQLSYVGGTGNDVTLTRVARIATTTTLGSSANPATQGSTVTFTAGVSSGSGTPGGNVVFKDNGSVFATTSLVSGSASASTATLTVGTHVVTAEYQGDPMFDVSAATLAPDQLVTGTQAITFAALGDKIYGDAAFTVGATGGASGNPVVFSSLTTGVCTAGGANGSTITLLATGTCTVAADQAGGGGYFAAPQVSRSFTVASAAQAITFNALANRSLGSGPFTVSATGGASGNAVIFTSQSSSVCSTGGTNGSTVTLLTLGTCTIAADQAGSANYSAAPTVTQSFQVADTTAPDTTITSGPAALTNSAAATFAFTGSDAAGGTGVASFECALDAGAFAACASPKAYTGLAEGAHTFQVRAIDGAGNVDATPASAAWTIDLTAPTLAFTVKPPIRGTNQAAYAVAGTCSDDGRPIALQIGSVATSATCGNPSNGTFQTVNLDVTALPQGAVALSATLVDAAGNTTTVTDATTKDTVGPTLTIDTLDAISNGNKAAYAFGGTCESGGSAVGYTLVSGITLTGTAACAGGVYAVTGLDATGLTDGTVSFSVTQADSLANSTTTNGSVAKDAINPLLSLDALGVVNAANKAAYTVSGTCSENGRVVTITVGGLTATPTCTAGGFQVVMDLTSLADGALTINGTHQDAVGNTATASVVVAKDTVAPAAPSITAPVGTIFSATPTVTGTAEAASSVAVSIDGSAVGTVAATGGNFSLGPVAALAVGAHTVTAVATDAAGNASSASTANFYVAPPTTVNPATVADGTVGTAYSQSLTGANGTAPYSFAVTAGAVPAGLTLATNGALTGTPTGAGTFNFTVTATDANATNGPFSGSRAYTVAMAVGSQSITFPAQTATPTFSAGGTFAIAPTATASSGLPVTYSSLSTGTCTVSGITVTIVAAGTCTLAADQAGDANWNAAAQVTRSVSIAVSAQAITFNALANRSLGSAPFTVSATGGASGNAVIFTSQSSSVCSTGGTNGSTVTLLTLGTCTIAADQAGSANFTAAPTVMQSFQVTDTTPPDTSITSGPASLTNSAAATFAFTGSDAAGGTGVASFECALDAGAFAACASPKAYTGLAEGAHTFQVRAIDGAGNVDATPASASWTIDLTAPTLAFTVKPAVNGANQAAYSVAGTCSENGATVNVQVGSVATSATCGTPTTGQFATPAIDVTGLPQGPVVLSATLVDAAGNTTTVTDATTKDTVGPTLTIDPLDAISNGNKAAYAFGGTCESGGSSVAYTLTSGATLTGAVACAAGTYAVTGLDATGLTDGTVSFSVTQSDALNNPATTNGSVPKDTINPTLSFDALGAVRIANVSAYTVSGTCSENTRVVTVTVGALTATPTCTAGAFSVVMDLTSLADGPLAFNGSHRDAVGNTATATFNGTKDTVAPAAPSITAPVGTIFTATPTVTGTTEAASSVAVSIDGAAAGTVTATGGNFSLGPVALLAVGAHTVAAVATDAAGNASSASTANFYVAPTITVNPATVADGTVGTAYSQSLTASNGTAPYSFAVTAGAVPAGLTLATNGALTGTPTAGGSFNFTVTATDANATNGPFSGARAYTVAIAAGPQSITFPVQAATPTFSAGGTFTIAPTATASSGLPVSYSSLSTGTCTVSGTTVTIVAAGICTIAADQAGDASYAAAPQVTRAVTIAKAAQSIVFGGFSNHTFGDTPFFVSASGGGSGNPVVFTSQTPAVCTTSGTNGTLVTLVAAGSCSVDLFLAGNANYLAAETIQGFSVAQAPQSITFNAPAAHLLGDAPFTLSATGGASGNAVTFASTTTAVCTTSGTNGATVTLLTQGTCSITASQLGNANYQDATPVTRAFAVSGVLVEAHADYFSDFNSDGKADIAWKNVDGSAALWTMNGNLQSGGGRLFGAGLGWSIRLIADFNGDGAADIVWQHTDGRVAMWIMKNGVQVGGAVLLPAGTGWTPVLAADFNRDGKADILWQHADGSSALWIMNGTTQIGGGRLFGGGSGWFAKLVGDLNGDGKADIVWQHTNGATAVWIMDGFLQVGGAVLLPAASGWSPRLMGDFNGDGRADILWQHTDGRTAMWLMNGTAQIGGALLQGAGTGWSVTRVGDANGDGKSDIVWQKSDGTIELWLMNGITQVGSATLAQPGTGFKVTRMTDFSGDGRADLVLERADGLVRMLLLQGGVYAPFDLLPAATGWSLAP